MGTSPSPIHSKESQREEGLFLYTAQRILQPPTPTMASTEFGTLKAPSAMGSCLLRSLLMTACASKVKPPNRPSTCSAHRLLACRPVPQYFVKRTFKYQWMLARAPTLSTGSGNGLPYIQMARSRRMRATHLVWTSLCPRTPWLQLASSSLPKCLVQAQLLQESQLPWLLHSS